MGNVLEAAKQYLRNGWSVFPVPVGKKEPRISWKEFQQRHATDSEVTKWFSSTTSNIGIVTGAISNLAVVDLDGPEGVRSGRSMGLVSPGTVFTGNGQQLYYQDSRQKNTVKKVAGVDTRGEGGYVLAPPSIHPNGKTYRWANGSVPSKHLLPSWPSAMTMAVSAPTVHTSHSTGVPSVSPDPWLLRVMQGVGEGERHQASVKLISYLLSRHPYDYVKQVVLDWNQKCTPPQAESVLVFALDDIYARFKKGQYTSNWNGLKENDDEGQKGIDSTDVADYAAEYIDDLKKRKDRPKPELQTGYRELDEWTWGISRGEVYTVGGRPGTGKSSFLITVAYRLCQQGKRVLYVSTEMSKKDILDKVAAVALSIPAATIRSGQLSESDQTSIGTFMLGLKGLTIANPFEPTAEKLQAEVAKIQPDVVIFDHLQHIATGDDMRKDVSRFTRALKSIAMQYNCGVMVASQLTRLMQGVQPELHHLKESGTIEEESQIAVLLHREETQTCERVPVMLKVAKNRYGRPGVVALVFNAQYTRFEQIGEANETQNPVADKQATQGNPIRSQGANDNKEAESGLGGSQLRPDLNV